jgi:hypothetical protein
MRQFPTATTTHSITSWGAVFICSGSKRKYQIRDRKFRLFLPIDGNTVWERELYCTDWITVGRNFTITTLLYTPTEVRPVNSASCNDVLNRSKHAGLVKLSYGVRSVYAVGAICCLQPNNLMCGFCKPRDSITSYIAINPIHCRKEEPT